ncbi:MAG: lipid-transfer protein, partial [Deltaproteobacteria bacterium]|nr:lipid-transfer protein [Deltaproteobacteria bacterium]
MSKVNVIGVGMVKFGKPGKSDPYNTMASDAARKALADAGIGYGEVQQAYAGYVFGDSTCGQRALYEVGLTGIPIFNVNNNCSTGSTALMLGAQAIKTGTVDCVLVVGFEQMQKGALGAKWDD